MCVGVPKELHSDFDPRIESDKVTSNESLRESVQQLLDVYPDACLGHLWGIDARPPDAEQTVEVETTFTMADQVQQLMITPGKLFFFKFRLNVHLKQSSSNRQSKSRV